VSLSSIRAFLRPALVLLAFFFAIGLAGTAYQVVRTLQQLTIVEALRDSWQQPNETIRHLNLKEGAVVVDLGSGAGYFALKLSDDVGKNGRVIAVDLRRLSLLFLRIRALLLGKHDIETIVGDTDDPHLRTSSVDSVLIANTYHELTDPHAILRHVSNALRPGGRIVVIDRMPGDRDFDSAAHHHVVPSMVETDLREAGLDILSREDSFIHPPGDEVWWLIVAGKRAS
jgi:SAM-dependent methyltransferase